MVEKINTKSDNYIYFKLLKDYFEGLIQLFVYKSFKN